MTLKGAVGFTLYWPHFHVLAVLTFAGSARADGIESSIVGGWKVISLTTKEVVTGKTDQPYGARPGGHRIFTRGGLVMSLLVAENRNVPGGYYVNNFDRAQLFGSMSAWSGTYRVDGNKVVVVADAAWNPSWSGREYLVEINGSRLTMTSAPFESWRNGQKVVGIVAFERVE